MLYVNYNIKSLQSSSFSKYFGVLNEPQRGLNELIKMATEN